MSATQDLNEDLDMICNITSSVKAQTFFMFLRKQLELYCAFKLFINVVE